jgi:hypothetical protein
MVKAINLSIAFLLELCMLAALAYWGFQATESGLINATLGICTPLFAILIWARYMAPKSESHLTGWRYLLVKALLYGLTAILLASTGKLTLAIAFAGVAVISEGLGIVWKQTPLQK